LGTASESVGFADGTHASLFQESLGVDFGTWDRPATDVSCISVSKAARGTPDHALIASPGIDGMTPNAGLNPWKNWAPWIKVRGIEA